MRLHPNAAIRALRSEQMRLHEARGRLLEAMEAQRCTQLQAMGIGEQIAQCGRELTELEDGVAVLEASFEAEQGQLELTWPPGCAVFA